MYKLIAKATVFSVFIALFLAPLVFAAEKYGPQKVVYHFNQNNLKVTASGLKNLQNHFNAVGKINLEAKAVFHGGGVFTLFKEPKNQADKKLVEIIQSRVMDLKARGTDFNICSNTLKGKKIDYKKDLYDVNAEDIVPSGVAEISKLQIQGYTYIKP